MNNTLAVAVHEVPTMELATPPVTTPLDAEVDIEVLKTVPKAFAIDCEERANWLIRKVLMARQYAERVKSWAEQELRRAKREEDTLLFLFGRQAEQWGRAEIAALDGGRKSLSLPAGMLGFRTINPCLHIDDERAVLNWAKVHCPVAVLVVEKISRSALKAEFEQHGVIPDQGAHVDPGEERFFIR